MKKILFVIIVSVSFCLLPGFKMSAAENQVTFSYPSKDTLVIEGDGVVPGQDFEQGLDDEKYMDHIKKIVIKEGITGLGDSCFARYYERVVTIELPSTLCTIGKSAFLGCVSLKKINLPSGISEIPEGCFEECYDLSQVEIPDTVTKIERDAFRECGKLTELVLPKQLEVWKNPMRKCPKLKKIINPSRIAIELDDCKGNKIWYSKGKKVTKLGAGGIAESKGRKYKITYNLLGGKKSGKLPSSYTYGKSIKLPLNAKKKNYSLLGWYNPADTDTYLCYLSETSPTLSGDIKLRPFWVKYRIRAVGNRSVEIFLDDRDAVVPFGAFDVRYSTNKNMENAKYFHMTSEGEKKVVRNLKRGKTYYFQIAYTDTDMEDWGDTWVGKRRIVIT